MLPEKGKIIVVKIPCEPLFYSFAFDATCKMLNLFDNTAHQAGPVILGDSSNRMTPCREGCFKAV